MKERFKITEMPFYDLVIIDNETNQEYWSSFIIDLLNKKDYEMKALHRAIELAAESMKKMLENEEEFNITSLIQEYYDELLDTEYYNSLKTELADLGRY